MEQEIINNEVQEDVEQKSTNFEGFTAGFAGGVVAVIMIDGVKRLWKTIKDHKKSKTVVKTDAEADDDEEPAEDASAEG